MTDKVIEFPGVLKPQEITVEELFADILKTHNLKSVVLIGVLADGEDGNVMVSGNTTVMQGVYLMEIGKQILIT